LTFNVRAGSAVIWVNSGVIFCTVPKYSAKYNPPSMPVYWTTLGHTNLSKNKK
jgi:hypothetical protein